MNSASVISHIGKESVLSRDSIARSFGSAASTYNQHAALQRQVAERLLATTPELPESANILDIGCGTGFCGSLLRKQYPDNRLYGLDLAGGMLEQCAASQDYNGLICADAESIPCADGSIDLLCSSLTIQWSRQPDRLFRELARIMRAQGSALLSTFGPASLQELRRAWSKVDDYTHVNSFLPAERLTALAAAAGLYCTVQKQIITEHYASLYALSRTLKAIGAHNMNRGQAPGLTTPGRFRQAAGFFAQGHAGKIPVTWEIYYLSLQVK